MPRGLARAALLALLLLACAPTVPREAPAPPREPAPVVLIVDPPAAAPDGVHAGADPLEGQVSAGPAPEAGAAAPGESGSTAAGPPGGLPTWLRAVRQPPAPSVVGSGRSWPKRVGLQVGHWGSASLPDELAQLRTAGGGASGGGYSEEQVNYDLATRTAARLRERGLEVDVIPATVPMDYTADAFVAIHADGDARGALRGYKIARSPLSQIPEHDDALVGWLYAEYGRATGLPRDDDHITRRMLFYYAFNNRRYYHAIAPGTPAAIVETGFMTSAADRALLVGTPDRAAAGLAAGILGFLGLGS